MHVSLGGPVQRFVLSLGLVLALSGVALADSTVSTVVSLGWSSATFSGTVAPSNSPNPYSTLTEAEAMSLTAPNWSNGNTDTPAGWVPATSSAQVGATDYAIASANTTMTAVSGLSTSTGLYSLFAQTERSGLIVSTNGTVQISIPYTFSMTAGNNGDPACCFTSAEDQVWIDLFNASGTQSIKDIDISFQDQFNGVGGYSNSGMLTLDVTGLAPGDYWFDIGAQSEVIYAPEPATLLLLGAGLLGTRLRRRFA